MRRFEWAMYYVYMIKNSADKLYIEITGNPKQRLHEHNTNRGAHFTKYIPTYQIAFIEEYPTITEARKREVQIKKWRRDKKEMLMVKYNNGLPTKMK
ncbi:MAG: GIY-YIG nuclease family protein [Candidatus Vogelbacteria bacterium]|nr:GIY-YIG nuclease family protein [Candidatus Vogelbacteria bacterium]